MLAVGCYASYSDENLDAGTGDTGTADPGVARDDGPPPSDTARDDGPPPSDMGADESGAWTCRPALEVTLEAGGDCADYEIPAEAPTARPDCSEDTGYLVVVHRPTAVECCVLTTADADLICSTRFRSWDGPCTCAGSATRGCTRPSGAPPFIAEHHPAGTSTVTYVLWLQGWDGAPVRLRICPYRAAWCY